MEPLVGGQKSSSIHEKRKVSFESYSQDNQYVNYRGPPDSPVYSEFNAGDVRSSEESITCDLYPEETGEDDRHHYSDYLAVEKEKICEKPLQNTPYLQAKRPSARYSTSFKNSGQGISSSQDCGGIDVPQAVITLQKLRMLKDLQRQRDLNEEYYSKEIRRLIDGQFFNTKRDSLCNKGKNSPVIHPRREELSMPRMVKGLEPCGTMTTITRLECGCVEEVTRPIFTPTIGGERQQTNCQHEKLDINLAPLNTKVIAHSSPRLKSKRQGPQYYSPLVSDFQTKRPHSPSRKFSNTSIIST